MPGGTLAPALLLSSCERRRGLRDSPSPRSSATRRGETPAERPLRRQGKATLPPGHPIGRTTSAAIPGDRMRSVGSQEGEQRDSGETGEPPPSAPPGVARNPGRSKGVIWARDHSPERGLPPVERLPELNRGAPRREGRPESLNPVFRNRIALSGFGCELPFDRLRTLRRETSQHLPVFFG